MPFIVFLLALFLAACPAEPYAAKDADNAEVHELWTGSVLTATFKAGVCTKKNGSARGVLLLTHATGQTDVYHVYGYKEGSYFELRHASGHIGKITGYEGGLLKGTVRLKSGFKINVQGRSRLNVPLSDDCAPIQ